jgi:hypothetical protein
MIVSWQEIESMPPNFESDLITTIKGMNYPFNKVALVVGKQYFKVFVRDLFKYI